MNKKKAKEFRQAVGARLSQIRAGKGLTYQQLATLVELPKSSLHNIEHGNMASRFENVVAYATGLGVDALNSLCDAIRASDLGPAPAAPAKAPARTLGRRNGNPPPKNTKKIVGRTLRPR